MPKKVSSRAKAPKTRMRMSATIGALVVIDSAPIRARVLAEANREEEKLNALRAELDEYTLKDVPEYGRWLSATFGSELTKGRELDAEWRKNQDLLIHIEAEIMATGCGYGTAYNRVMKARQEEERADANPAEADDNHWEDAGPAAVFTDEELDDFIDGVLGGGFDPADYDQLSPREQQSFREEVTFILEAGAIFEEDEAPTFDQILERLRARSPKRRSRKAKSKEAPEPVRTADPLKDLYRKMVRRLHPDTGAEMSPLNEQLWHEVQAAYQAKDLSRLEALEARLDLRETGDAPSVPIGRLIEMVKDLRRRFQSLARERAELKQTPQWHFSSLTKAELQKRHRQTERELKRHLKELTEEVDYTKRRLEEIAAMADQAARRKKAPPKAPKKGKRGAVQEGPTQWQQDLF